MNCTFFGHKNVPNEIEEVLRLKIIDLIENHNVDRFYVGNHGGFDIMVYRILKDLSGEYNIKYNIVLAYIPRKNDSVYYYDFSSTILPENIESVPKRFAINYRNKWMIDHSDYVITYVTNQYSSGSAKFRELAKKHNKMVVDI